MSHSLADFSRDFYYIKDDIKYARAGVLHDAGPLHDADPRHHAEPPRYELCLFFRIIANGSSSRRRWLEASTLRLGPGCLLPPQERDAPGKQSGPRDLKFGAHGMASIGCCYLQAAAEEAEADPPPQAGAQHNKAQEATDQHGYDLRS